MTEQRAGGLIVDRLSINAGAMPAADARRLAELVALALGRLPIQSSPSTVSVNVPAQEGHSVEQLSEVVAAALAAALRVEAAS